MVRAAAFGTGHRRRLTICFVTKNRRKARAVIFSHQFGWEVRLLVGSQEELVSSQVCRTQEEVLTTGDLIQPVGVIKGLWNAEQAHWTQGRRIHSTHRM